MLINKYISSKFNSKSLKYRLKVIFLREDPEVMLGNIIIQINLVNEGMKIMGCWGRL